MGLDQYALSRTPAEPEFRWRKHPNLQGWMERLWESRGGEGCFNCVELRLYQEDIQQLATDIMSGNLNGGDEDTEGFFFGNNSDEHYRDQDLEFCKWALKELAKGNEVIYDSWW
tara:strand:+ start:1477 stop:1818 length:342 start_codon:yes stop_codon:yes gene_type:complete